MKRYKVQIAKSPVMMTHFIQGKLWNIATLAYYLF